MGDKLVVKNPDHFTTQAQKHRQMADHTRTMLSAYQTYHNNLLDATANSCLGGAMQVYMDWWEGFRNHLQNHADLHDQMASHLEQALQGYQTNETDLVHSFTPEQGAPEQQGS